MTGFILAGFSLFFEVLVFSLNKTFASNAVSLEIDFKAE